MRPRLRSLDDCSRRSGLSTDTNECELLGSVCGEAQCVNVEGSFLCVCPDGQDYNVLSSECEPPPTGESHIFLHLCIKTKSGFLPDLPIKTLTRLKLTTYEVKL